MGTVYDIGQQLAFSRALCDLALEPFLGSFADLARFDDVLDVGAGAEPANDLPGLAAHRDSAAQYPPIIARSMAHTMFDFVKVAGFKAMPPHFPGPITVVGMKHVFPSPAVHRALRHAGVVVPTLIVEVEIPVGQGRPDHLVDRVGNRVKPRVALAQGLLGALTLCDIVATDEQPGRFASVVHNGLNEQVDKPVVRTCRQLDRQIASLKRNAGRVNPVEKLNALLAFQLWKHVTHGSAKDVARSRYLHVSVVDVLVDVLGSGEQADEAGHLLHQPPLA